MDLICWAANAIDQIYSTMRGGKADPTCPGGTSAAGYVNDPWGKWRIFCLSQLSLEDVEDVYIIGLLVSGFLLIGTGGTWMYRNVAKWLSDKGGLGVLCAGTQRDVQTQTDKLNGLEAKIDALSARVYRIEVSLGRLETIMERVSARLGGNQEN